MEAAIAAGNIADQYYQKTMLENQVTELLTTESHGTDYLQPHQVNICQRHGSDIPCEVCAILEADKIKKIQLQTANLMPSIHVGKRFHGSTFESFMPSCHEATRAKKICKCYADTFAERLENGDNLLMTGRPGTGKNMLAACICKQIAIAGYVPLHTTAMKLTRRIKESWGSAKTETEQMAIKAFTTPDLLVIDEVGAQFGSKTEELLLFEVLNDRYEDMKPTILISNFSMEDIEKFLGERIIDRIHAGKSTVVSFTWESFRRKTQ